MRDKTVMKTSKYHKCMQQITKNDTLVISINNRIKRVASYCFVGYMKRWKDGENISQKVFDNYLPLIQRMF
jgi:molybdopterin synthase catalytic subunit